MTKQERYATKQRRASGRLPGKKDRKRSKKRREKIARRKREAAARLRARAARKPVYKPLPSAQGHAAPALLAACFAAMCRVRTDKRKAS